jgi:hypothetical protein
MINDFPIDPDVCDGVELSDILNRMNSERLTPLESKVNFLESQPVGTDPVDVARISALEVQQAGTSTIVNGHSTTINQHSTRLDHLESLPQMGVNGDKYTLDKSLDVTGQLTSTFALVAGNTPSSKTMILPNGQMSIGGTTVKRILVEDGAYHDIKADLSDESEARLEALEALGSQSVNEDSSLIDGMIILWSLKQSKPPEGFVLCDGENNSPNMLENPYEDSIYLMRSKDAGQIPDTFDLSWEIAGKNTIKISSNPNGSGWYYFGDSEPAIPEVPAVPPELGEDGTEISPEIPAVPEVPAIPEGRIFSSTGKIAYEYRNHGQYEVTFVPSYGLIQKINVEAVESHYVIHSDFNEFKVLLSVTGDISGTYHLGNGIPEVPEVPAVPPELGEDGTEISPEIPAVPAVPAVPEDIIESKNGEAVFTYDRQGTFTITFIPDDGNDASTLAVTVPSYLIKVAIADMTVQLTNTAQVQGSYDLGDGIPEVPEVPAVPPVVGEDGSEISPEVPAIPAVPAVPPQIIESSLTGSAVGTYTREGTFTITFTPKTGSGTASTVVSVPDAVSNLNYDWQFSTKAPAYFIVEYIGQLVDGNDELYDAPLEMWIWNQSVIARDVSVSDVGHVLGNYKKGQFISMSGDKRCYEIGNRIF